ncbi:thioredoxin domain-containing protein [Phenylobacterium koreense]|uniref:thioredoxin domain-containing protein n=1 Tax=Phenylobacterium koreense TaxID=266125 RepID=UPI00339B7879
MLFRRAAALAVGLLALLLCTPVNAAELGFRDLLRNPGTPLAGASDADVIIVMYADYNCGYCKRMEPVLAAALKTDNHPPERSQRLHVTGTPQHWPQSRLRQQEPLGSRREADSSVGPLPGTSRSRRSALRGHRKDPLAEASGLARCATFRKSAQP